MQRVHQHIYYIQNFPISVCYGYKLFLEAEEYYIDM